MCGSQEVLHLPSGEGEKLVDMSAKIQALEKLIKADHRDIQTQTEEFNGKPNSALHYGVSLMEALKNSSCSPSQASQRPMCDTFEVPKVSILSALENSLTTMNIGRIQFPAHQEEAAKLGENRLGKETCQEQSTTPLTPAPPSTAVPSPKQTPDSEENYVPIQNPMSSSPVPSGTNNPTPKKNTDNVNYIALDFQRVSQSPHHKPSTSSVASDEKGEYVQVDKEKTQALQKTIQEWTKMWQSSRPSKDAKLW
ncbi:GRB2-associated-binding protein 2 [Cricetulus griseus]|nr:GRB2-associated-binding protein 2 [Cricetulus griseus]